MKSNRTVVRFLAAAALSAQTFVLCAAPTVRPDSKIWLVGDSTLHEYSSNANNVAYQIGFDPAAKEPNASDKIKQGRMTQLDVTIPVNEMRSGKNGLDKNMQKALKSAENPDIRFHLLTYQIAASSVSATAFVVNAKGELEVAGVTNKVDIVADAEPVADGVTLKGSKKLLMTDYGVRPPKILMIKTTNDVMIHFELHVSD